MLGDSDIENAQAFALFSASFTLALLLYILTLPHISATMSGIDAEQRMLTGLAKAASWNTAGPWWRTWWRRRTRRKDLERLIGAGVLSDDAWVAKFVQSSTPRVIWQALDDLVARGLMQEPEQKESESGAE
jgi:hypothetical protein